MTFGLMVPEIPIFKSENRVAVDVQFNIHTSKKNTLFNKKMQFT
jgi:hypothetical protein